jgi:hypothetical protein
VEGEGSNLNPSTTERSKMEKLQVVKAVDEALASAAAITEKLEAVEKAVEGNEEYEACDLNAALVSLKELQDNLNDFAMQFEEE